MAEIDLVNAKKRYSLTEARLKSWNHTVKLTLSENLYDLETQNELLAQLLKIIENAGIIEMDKFKAIKDPATQRYIILTASWAIKESEKSWIKYIKQVENYRDETVNRYAIRQVMFQVLAESGEVTARDYFLSLGWDYDETALELANADKETVQIPSH